MKHLFLQIKPAHFNSKILFLFYFSLLTFHFSLSYSQQPTLEWVARYLRPSGSSAIPNQMALDKVGNCYVFGNIPISGGVGGFLTIKYNSNGDTVWTRSYNIGSGNATVNEAIIADSIGNVYVTGYMGPTFGPYDIVTIKYNPSGVQQWIRIYAGAGNVSDTPGDITLDKFGRPYIAGGSGGEALIIKYDTNGDSIWVRKFNTSGYRSGVGSIAVNSQGYVYAGGNATLISTNARNYLVIKYDSNGVYQWSDMYMSLGFESARKMTIDRFDNCFITGEGSDGVTDGALTIKYNSSGTRLWLKVFRYGVTTDANDMVTDLNGNAYVTGAYSVGAGNFNYITVKYNATGDSLWVRNYNGSANDNDEAYSITTDDSNNIYVTGRSINSGVSWDYVTIKYTSAGSQSWIATYNNQLANAEDIASKVIVDKNRNVYVTGLSRGMIGGGLDYVTIKYSQPVGINPIIAEIPNEFYLHQNYPNPFNPQTKIRYELPKNSDVQIYIYDITGKLITKLISEYHRAGIYEVTFNAFNYSSGIYFYKLVTDKYTETRKMVLIK